MIMIIGAAASPLGSCLARSLAAEGEVVVGTWFTSEERARELAAAGVECLQLDVRDARAVEALFDKAERQWGPLTTLINNAAIASRLPVALLSSQGWDATIATNLSGAFYACRAAARRMIPRRAGQIINIGSRKGAGGATEGEADYAASKAGLFALSEVLARELAPLGIGVVTVTPRPFASTLNRNAVASVGHCSARPQDAVVEAADSIRRLVHAGSHSPQ